MLRRDQDFSDIERAVHETARALGLVLLLPIAAVLVLAFPASAILQNIGEPAAIRVTDTAGLTPGEQNARECQGNFRGFLAAPISDKHLLTAQHIGIQASDTIVFDSGLNAGTYTIATWYDDPGSDLRVVEINETFAAWTELYAAPDEVDRTVTIFGRGGAPNGSVFVGAELKGWTTGVRDGEVSWGRNRVSGTFGTDLLHARFDRTGLPTEGGLSTGDSGGGWFILDAFGVPRLAAISFAVTGPFQQDLGGAPDGVVFGATLFDIGGLWVGEPGDEVLIPENPVDIAGVAFGTRISSRIGWIETVVPLDTIDSDNDGVPDGQDNCPHVFNPSQTDTGGLGFGTTPDGIGNACQCGDVTGEGQVNDTDAAFIKRQALGLAAPLFLVPDNCDVTGDGRCTGVDGTLIRHAAAGSIPEAFGQFCPNAQP